MYTDQDVEIPQVFLSESLKKPKQSQPIAFIADNARVGPKNGRGRTRGAAASEFLHKDSLGRANPFILFFFSINSQIDHRSTQRSATAAIFN
jgi:hypothetical protein